MQWKSDLESLVEQTKAMVKSANLRGSELVGAPEVWPRREASVESFAPRVIAASPPRIATSSLSRVAPASPPRVTETSPPRVTTASQEREAIKQRVAGFKAHQEKLRREREQYYLEMTAKVRDMLRNGTQNEK
jgi:hypothetical protein